MSSEQKNVLMVKTEPMFRYVKVSNFMSATNGSEKYFNNVNDFANFIQVNEFSKNDCIFEVLRNHIRRLYFDIEKIPVNNSGLIHELVHDLATFIGINPNDYGLTINEHSTQHNGLSYHLTFPYKSHAVNILNLIRNFKVAYSKYTEYIDEGVYDKRRLFRVPGQYKIGKFDASNPTNVDSADYHKIIHGTLHDLIIQNIETIPFLDKTYKNVSYRILKPVHVSNPSFNNSEKELIQQLINLQASSVDTKEETTRILSKNNMNMQTIFMIVMTLLLIINMLKK